MNLIGITIIKEYSKIFEFLLLKNHIHFSIWYIGILNDYHVIKKMLEQFKINNLKFTEINILKNKDDIDQIIYLQKKINKKHKNANILILDQNISLPFNFINLLPNKLESNTLYHPKHRINYESANKKNLGWSYPYSEYFNTFFHLYNNNLGNNKYIEYKKDKYFRDNPFMFDSTFDNFKFLYFTVNYFYNL